MPNTTSVAELRKRRSTIARRMDQICQRGFNLANKAEFELLDSEAARLKEQIQQIEGPENQGARRDRYRAFCRYLRQGINADPQRGFRGISNADLELLRRPGAEERDMGEGLLGGAYPGSVGGFVAPILFADMVASALKFYSDLFVSSTVIPTAVGTPFPYPNYDDTAVSGELVPEGAQTQAADIGSQGQVVFSTYKISSQIVKASIELVSDSAIPFEVWLAIQFAIRIARGMSPYLTIGTGPTSNPLTSEPTGIITAATWSGQTVIGDDNASVPNPATQVGFTDLLNLESSVDVEYRRRGSYLMHDSTFQSIKNLRDKQGRPLRESMGVLEVPDEDRPNMTRCYLNGHRVYFTESMDTLGPIGSPPVGAKAVAFGDLSKFVIRQLRSLIVLRLAERWVDYGQIGFVAYQRMDSNLLSAGQPVKYLQCAA